MSYLTKPEPVEGTPVTVPRKKQPGRPSTDGKMADALLKVAELITQIKASSDEQTKQMLSNQAEQLIRTMPENRFPPLVSCFNPEGDRDHPRPELKCPVFHDAYRLEREQLSTAEINLLNNLQPGNYKVTKADGTIIPFDVAGEFDNGGKLQKMRFAFPSKGDERHNHLGLSAYLREIQGIKAPTVQQLEAELAKLKLDLAEARDHAA